MLEPLGLPKDLTADEFTRFRDYINGHSGIYLEDSKRDSLRISLVTRTTRRGFESFDEYFRILTADEDEFKELMNLVTINETSFFRFPAQFEALRDHVLPEVMRSRPQGRQHAIRIWSAGCSTGEEPYSIAITLAEAGLEGLGRQPHVLGTDVSTAALNVARRAVYSTKSLLNVPPEVVRRHFEETEAGQRVRRQTRSMVEFSYHNLIKEPYPLSLMGAWDAVFCRNVTIYFKLESTRRVVENFYRMLNPGGYLFVGHSETLTNISSAFEPLEVGGVFLYRRPVARPFAVAPLQVPPAAPDGKARPDGAGTTKRCAVAKAESGTSRPEPADGASEVEASSETEALFEEARRLAGTGRPEEVLAVVERLEEADPEGAEAHLLAAYVHADLGDYAEALAACRRALAVNPLLPSARFILGIIHQRQGDVPSAVSELKKTIYIDADFALAHLNLGNLYKSQRKWDAASRSYENALRALSVEPRGEWSVFMGGFQTDLLVKTVERSLLECRKASSDG
ncbi:MAG: tetratricopeptide repeat protein [Coriobacteriia bacterium]|nr:tetratricopeptide repeat protein [Coriobacteriia bacterium]